MEIVITSNNNKMNLLKKLLKEKRFNKYKFYTMNEFKKNMCFDYNDEALEYIVSKYHVNLNIAKIYMDNMYFLENKKYIFFCFINKIYKITKYKLRWYNAKFFRIC